MVPRACVVHPAVQGEHAQGRICPAPRLRPQPSLLSPHGGTSEGEVEHGRDREEGTFAASVSPPGTVVWVSSSAPSITTGAKCVRAIEECMVWPARQA